MSEKTGGDATATEIRCDCPICKAAILARRNAELERAIDAWRDAHHAQAGEIRRLQGRLDAAREEARSLGVELGGTRAVAWRAAELAAERDRLKAELDALSRRHAGLLDEIGRLRARHGDALRVLEG